MLTVDDRSDTAVQALKLGAFDYIAKPVNVKELNVAIEKALESTRLRRQIAQLQKEQERRFGARSLVGKSPAMERAFGEVSKVAQSGATTVLVTGETGTGKEVVARAIHCVSHRNQMPFMAVNCSALTESLAESELFGHEKGAFTDARTQRKGLFELADGGTVFLDEIGDASASIQSKLLRVLDEKAFRRVGGTRDIFVDVRIIAATNQSLEQMMTEGKFRRDLFYRLNVAHIHLPPVRERGDDVLLLAHYFLDEFNSAFHKHFKGLSEDTKRLFMEYEWPGNVREIRNVVERAALLDEGDFIFSHEVHLGHFHDLRSDICSPTVIQAASDDLALHELEKKVLIEALKRADNNQSKAAQLLKISRDTLRYRMKKYKLFK